MVTKSREELQQLADELGIEIIFDSHTPGFTIVDENKEVVEHFDYDAVSELIIGNLTFK